MTKQAEAPAKPLEELSDEELDRVVGGIIIYDSRRACCAVSFGERLAGQAHLQTGLARPLFNSKPDAASAAPGPPCGVVELAPLTSERSVWPRSTSSTSRQPRNPLFLDW